MGRGGVRAPLFLAGLIVWAIAHAGCSAIPSYDDEDDQPDKPKNPVEERVSGVADKCLQADIAALPCSDENPQGQKPDPAPFQWGRAALTFAVEQQTQLPFVQFAALARGDEKLAGEFHDAMASVLPRLKSKIERDHLDACHSACLVKCMTSQLLTYDDWQYEHIILQLFARSADRGADYAGGSGMGVCRNFANLGEEIGHALGMNLEPVTTKAAGHVVMRFQDGSRSYLMDPQVSPLDQGRCIRQPI